MKKAFLIGINYIGTDCELRGCISDIECIKNLLITDYGYDLENINILTDLTQLKPTRANIIQGMQDLIKGTTEDDNLVMYYSGHGTKVYDANHDEKTGYDEAICPIDMKMIIDDDILDILSTLQGATLKMFFDCCHSGTISDLTYNLRYSGSQKLKNGSTLVPTFDIWTEKSKEINGRVCMFSGCLDYQTSADCQFVKKHEFCNNGAFTWMLLNFLSCVKDQNLKIPTNREVVIQLYQMLHANEFQQIPQFSCSDVEDFDRIFCL